MKEQYSCKLTNDKNTKINLSCWGTMINNHWPKGDDGKTLVAVSWGEIDANSKRQQ